MKIQKHVWFLLSICFLFLSFSGAEAADRYVSSVYGQDNFQLPNDCTSPLLPCRTIQHAINQAGLQPGSAAEIKVGSGIYTENIAVTSNASATSVNYVITGGWNYHFVESTGNPGDTIIGGLQNGRIFSLRAEAGSTMVISISGFTMSGGRADFGGAVQIVALGSSTADVNLSDNVIKENVAIYAGSAIHAITEYYAVNNNDNSLTLTLTDNMITGNTVEQGVYDLTAMVGAIEVGSHQGTTTLDFARNVIQSNHCGGGDCASIGASGINVDTSVNSGNTVATLENNIVAHHYTHGIRFTAFRGLLQSNGTLSLELSNNTIVDNTGVGLDIDADPVDEAYLHLVNNILWGHYGSGDLRISGNVRVTSHYNDVGTTSISTSNTYSNNDNISENPLFRRPFYEPFDYRLTTDSPARNGGICGSLPRLRFAPLLDFEGDPRPDPGDLICSSYFGSICIEGSYYGCDIGADEYFRKFAIGIFRNGRWYLDGDANGAWDAGVDDMVSFGTAGDIPVPGDWNGDGISEIGVKRGTNWYLDYNGNGSWDGCVADRCYNFGLANDIPVAGNWDGTGGDEIGVFRNGNWYLDFTGNGTWNGCGTDTCISFGTAGDVPVTGDWNGDGSTEAGVFRNGEWYLDYSGDNAWSGCGTDRCSSFGLATDVPVVGDWSGTGDYKIGVRRGTSWYLDYNGNGAWNGCTTDGCSSFGLASDLPVSGNW